MITETGATAGVVEEVITPYESKADTGKALPPPEFVSDNGQILLELLRSRAEEDRRRFVTSLRRLRVAPPP